ncbi:MAG: nitrile hydratase subunit beta [SAR202 cluster bacterium]|nr:nitrile hydratase subunit beta [SAR202 cluster bacterium]
MAAQTSTKFKAGDRVRVSSREHKGHHRTPWYVKGKSGVVVKAHGAYTNPESLAYGGSGEPAVQLYLVQFRQKDLWTSYGGPDSDNLCVDIFEHWLEPA